MRCRACGARAAIPATHLPVDGRAFAARSGARNDNCSFTTRRRAVRLRHGAACALTGRARRRRCAHGGTPQRCGHHGARRRTRSGAVMRPAPATRAARTACRLLATTKGAGGGARLHRRRNEATSDRQSYRHFRNAARRSSLRGFMQVRREHYVYDLGGATDLAITELVRAHGVLLATCARCSRPWRCALQVPEVDDGGRKAFRERAEVRAAAVSGALLVLCSRVGCASCHSTT